MISVLYFVPSRSQQLTLSHDPVAARAGGSNVSSSRARLLAAMAKPTEQSLVLIYPLDALDGRFVLSDLRATGEVS